MPNPGSPLNRFVVLELLGTEGMGEGDRICAVGVHG